MDRRVLAFFGKLVVTDNALVRAALTANFEGQSMWLRVLGALNNMLAHFPVALSELPAATSATLGVWAQFAILHADRWRELVRTYGSVVYDDEALPGVDSDSHEPPAGDGVDFAELGVVPPPPDVDDGPGPVLGHPEDEVVQLITFDCDLCHYKGKTHSGLQAHRRRSHQIHPPLSLRVSMPKCDCCNLNFGTRARVLDHMRQSKRCASYVLENVEPLTPRSFALMMERNRYVDESETRDMIPKAGPKPKGVRPPTCAYTAAFLDEAQRLASVAQLD
eukprot:3803166-Amphidinium_carterae.1